MRIRIDILPECKRRRYTDEAGRAEVRTQRHIKGNSCDPFVLESGNAEELLASVFSCSRFSCFLRGLCEIWRAGVSI